MRTEAGLRPLDPPGVNRMRNTVPIAVTRLLATARATAIAQPPRDTGTACLPLLGLPDRVVRPPLKDLVEVVLANSPDCLQPRVGKKLAHVRPDGHYCGATRKPNLQLDLCSSTTF